MGVPVFFLLDLLFEGGIPSSYTGRVALSLAYQGVLVSGFNVVINIWLLKYYRPSTLAPIYLTTPLFGVGWTIIRRIVIG